MNQYRHLFTPIRLGPVRVRNRVVFSFAAMAVGAMVMAVLWSDASGAEQTRIELSPLVGKMLDDATLSDAQRRELLLFHG